ncbi:MAG: cytochrome ubiquinol oxidase subunit I [Myxococcales bacterium]|nr:cytochrome ubiquinol oxidase subunit I [Myxococcales bacterium]
MDLDPVFLSRAQFGLTIMFHYLFPPLSIGLGLIMVICEAVYLWTRDIRYEAATRFLTKIFAVNFAVGVATGIVMEFQFGTNWSTYSRFVGDVFGSALAAEGIFAFFLESGFLAVLVFGWDRVTPRVHFFSTIMVFLGSVFSAVWIIIANSWQQTPAGFHLVGETGALRAEITDFWVMIFNPSSMHRLGHVLLGSFTQGAFFVMSICAFYILKNCHREFSTRMFGIALSIGCISSWALLVSGHSQAQMVAEHQPAKLAAFEGLYQTSSGGTGLYLLGWPDEEKRMVRAGVKVPNLLSLLVYGDADKPVPGLDRIPDDEEPPVWVPFMSYHTMVGLGTFFIAITSLAVFLWWWGTLFTHRWLMRIFVVSVAGPYLANQVGWVAAEVGRQPWVVYGLLRTKDAVSPSVEAWEVLVSIFMFSVIYIALLAVWLFVVNEKIQKGPETVEALRAKKADGDQPGVFVRRRGGLAESESMLEGPN